MKSINHLSKAEQEHFILCECGEFLDMRDLGEVFRHIHADLPPADWSYAIRKGDPAAYPKSGSRIDLN